MEKHSQQKPLSNLEIASFCGQMAMILKSGISALEGLSILLEDAENEQERSLLTVMNDDMAQNGKLHLALRRAEVFPPYLLQMIQIGEESGTLDDVMDALESHYTREDAVANSIRSALTYPLIMVGMMILVVVVLMTKVMPVFQQVFKQLGREMSGLSKGILAMGNSLSKYYYVFVIITIVIIFLLIYFTRSSGGRRQMMKLGYHFKFAKTLYDKMAACRFAGGMALTLKSGMMPEYGIELSENLIDNPYFCKKIDTCKSMLQEGCDLSQAFQETKIFTGVYARMISIANKTGKTDEVMSEIAEQYEDEVDAKITGFISMLEPTLVIILSVIVGIILLSVMLPLLGIMAGL